LLASAVFDGRLLSRQRGLLSLDQEIKRLGFAPVAAPISIVDRAADALRANRFADRLAASWYQLVDTGNTRAATKLLSTRIQLAGVTENAEAFNQGRAKYLRAVSTVELLKVWDATLDKRTCPVCSSADGTIVLAREAFPLGEPGAVHPRCRCVWHVIGTSERRLSRAA
jgi:hypothetical protein